ncbi:hypothetical protein F2P56_000697 [Juglans regia]|uniref:Uncharacterized protein n=1 Tax=Juglans regia TaxID=51240 RepID=A0A834D7R3_JUGRE|nr:hypothetical protein F2P56_000697 [Juglans regia]
MRIFLESACGHNLSAAYWFLIMGQKEKNMLLTLQFDETSDSSELLACIILLALATRWTLKSRYKTYLGNVICKFGHILVLYPIWVYFSAFHFRNNTCYGKYMVQSIYEFVCVFR